MSVYVLFVYFLFVEFCYTRINKHSPLNQQPFVITSRSDRERERITVITGFWCFWCFGEERERERERENEYMNTMRTTTHKLLRS